MARRELIQVLTDRYGYEILCEVSQENSYVQINGFTQKCNDVLNALKKTYREDTFRVLVDDDDEDEE